MAIRIFCTSDLHLGMKFASYPNSVQESLIEARFKTLESLVEKANSENCDLFVVCGDLFDRVSVSKKDIVRAAQAIGEFQGRLAAVLPGNHDYNVPGRADLWTHFDDHSGNNVLVFREKNPLSLSPYDLNLNLYPAPCHAKHSSENTIGWIKEAEKDPGVRHHIGIAHGSMEGFSPDFHRTYYPMTVDELNECGLDLWLIGHTHLQYPDVPGEMDTIFFAGTPEPDGFDCNHEGKAWILQIDENKNTIPTSISTGTYRFTREEIETHTTEDVKTLKSRYGTAQYRKTLLKLKVVGRLPEEGYNALHSARKEIEKHLFHLQWDDSQVTQEITPSDIDKMFTEDSFPHRLLMELTKSVEDFEALQEAYELIKEVKK